VIGFLYACHGAQKLFGVLGGQPHHEGLLLAAGIIEFFAGLMVAIGLQASIAAFVACGEMAVAYFMMHAPRALWPIKNMGEPAAVYCFFFLFVADRDNSVWTGCWAGSAEDRDTDIRRIGAAEVELY